MASNSPATSRSLGRTISARRKELKLSQKELAEKTLREDGQAISPQFLNDIERDRRRPGDFILKALAANLDLNADDLHLLAGQLPPDMITGNPNADRVKQVIEAFRRTYNKR